MFLWTAENIGTEVFSYLNGVTRRIQPEEYEPLGLSVQYIVRQDIGRTRKYACFWSMAIYTSKYQHIAVMSVFLVLSSAKAAK